MKYRVGDKVVPFQKTAPGWQGLEKSQVWKRAKELKQEYLYIVGKGNPTYCLSDSIILNNTGGDYFMEGDFKLYKEIKKSVTREFKIDFEETL